MRIGYCSLILLVKDFPCPWQISVKASGSQVYLVSIINVAGDPDEVINFVAPVVPSPTVPLVSTASAQTLPPIQPIGLHQFKDLK